MAPPTVQFSLNPAKLLAFTASVLGKGVRYVAGLGKSSTGVLLAEAAQLRALKTQIENQNPNGEVVVQWLAVAGDLIGEVERFERSYIYRVPYLKDCSCWVTDMLERVRDANTRGARLRPN